MKNHPISIRISDDERAWIEGEAARRGVTASEVIREAVRLQISQSSIAEICRIGFAGVESKLDSISSDLDKLGALVFKKFSALEATN